MNFLYIHTSLIYQSNYFCKSELNDKLKKYAQFMHVSDYEHLLENLRKQRKLAERIQDRTQLGLTKLAHIESYKREREKSSS